MHIHANEADLDVGCAGSASTRVAPARARAWPRAPHAAARTRRGAALVEFAFIALAFYLLFAGTIEMGRMVYAQQAIVSAARVGARELAMVELPATASFDDALADPFVRETIYDPGLLVLETEGMDDVQFQQRIDNFPALNRMLTPLMIRERLDLGSGEREYFRFPGAVLRVTNPGPTDPQFTVGIPKVVDRNAEGVETIEWVPVVEEVRPSTYAADPLSAPFSLVSTGREKGLVCLRINFPFQAATLSAFVTNPPSGGPANLPVTASDGAVSNPGGAPAGTTLANATGGNATYAGPFGLGRQYALGHTVRPFRRLISGQAMFRREVFSR
jgi:hypothetical protein